jgi:hypothetical protein
MGEAEEKFRKQQNISATHASETYTTSRKLHKKASSRTETQEIRHGILYV